MEKPVYLTGNKGKFEEAQYLFKEKYGIDIDIKKPDFEVIEIQEHISLHGLISRRLKSVASQSRNSISVNHVVCRLAASEFILVHAR